MIQPVLMGLLIGYFHSGSDVTTRQAYLLAGAIGITAIFPILTRHLYDYKVIRLGMWMRVACSSLIYKKVSRVLTWKRTYRPFNTLRSRQNGRQFPGDIFNCIFFNENVWISITISLKFVPKVPIDNKTALVQIMAWRRQTIIWNNDG